MDSHQQCIKAKERVSELQLWPDLEPIEQAELDRLISEINEFNEKFE